MNSINITFSADSLCDIQRAIKSCKGYAGQQIDFAPRSKQVQARLTWVGDLRQALAGIDRATLKRFRVDMVFTA